MEYDLIIIGGGPIGLVCGIEAQKVGLRYLILEKGVLVNSLYHFPTNMTFFSTSVLLEIGNIPFISHTDKPTRAESLEYYRRVTESWKLNIHLFEKVQNINKKDDLFLVTTNSTAYVSHSVIMATGFYDQEEKLNIPGEHLEKVTHYYTDAHPYFQKKLAIIGGGNSACDAALECWQKGASVTLIIKDKDIKESIKYWIKPNIENRIKEKSILAHFNSTVKEIKPSSILFEKEGIENEIENDLVLALTGYKPNYTFIESAGIHINDDVFRTPVYNETSLETNVPGLYLAGVVIGGMNTGKYFIETTRDHGQKIINHILSKS